jgi:regulator of RNase E activity RraB
MASRNSVANKLKLVVAYKNAKGEDKTRTLSFAKLKDGSDPTTLLNVAQAIAGLQPDTLSKVVETAEHEIVA